jgi:hypothetical protein
MTARKIATSIPADQYRALERARRSLKLNRSEAVQRAIGIWLATQQNDTRVQQYIRAHLTNPEDVAEGDAHVQAWASELSSEEW